MSRNRTQSLVGVILCESKVVALNKAQAKFVRSLRYMINARRRIFDKLGQELEITTNRLLNQ